MQLSYSDLHSNPDPRQRDLAKKLRYLSAPSAGEMWPMCPDLLGQDKGQ
jgi:hypothetical protein